MDGTKASLIKQFLMSSKTRILIDSTGLLPPQLLTAIPLSKLVIFTTGEFGLENPTSKTIILTSVDLTANMVCKV